MNLLLKIITPEKVIFQDSADEIIAPTVNGEIAILPNHIGLLTQIVPGELVVKKGTKTQSIAVTEGFLEVANNQINVLANYAVRAEDIQLAKAEKAKKRAEHLMSEKTSDKDFKIVQAELLKSLVELKIGNKHKRRSL